MSYITPMLCLSTTHIRQSTAEALEKGLKDKNGVMWDLVSYTNWHEYGWIIFAEMDAGLLAALVSTGYTDLAQCIEAAHKVGAGYLQLDCDEKPCPGLLPVYEWK